MILFLLLKWYLGFNLFLYAKLDFFILIFDAYIIIILALLI